MSKIYWASNEGKYNFYIKDDEVHALDPDGLDTLESMEEFLQQLIDQGLGSEELNGLTYDVRCLGETAWQDGLASLEEARNGLDLANRVRPGHVVVAVVAGKSSLDDPVTAVIAR